VAAPTVAGPASQAGPLVPEIKPAATVPAATPAASAPPPGTTQASPAGTEMDTLARLREAKKRARGG